MRSKAVLILVLVALSGLGYLLFMEDAPSPLDPVSTGNQAEEATETPSIKTTLDTPADRSAVEAPASSDRESIAVAEEVSAEIHPSGVTGRVVNDAGEPVEDAKMTLAFADEMFMDVAGVGGPDKPDRITKTDANGQYRFENLEPADYYTVIAIHETLGTGRLTAVKVPYRVYEEQADIVLSIGSALTGNITDPAGNPILDAKVTLGSNLFTRNASKRDWKLGRTDDVGHYVLPDIEGGTFSFMVEADGFGTHVLIGLPFDGKKARTRDVQLKFAEGIAGMVVDQRGTPVKNAVVTAIRNHNSKLSCRDSWVTKSDGQFELAHLEAGDFTVLVEAPGFRNGRQNVVPTGTNAITIELLKHGSVRGRVVSAADGSPLTSGSVLLRRVIQGTDVTDPTRIKAKIKGGDFELVGVEEGEYLVEASAIRRGFAPTFSAPFRVMPGEDHEGVMINATIGAKVIGKVIDLDGKPVANAQVSTEDRAGYLPGWPTNIIPQKVRTDSSGLFTLHALKPETYRINVEATGFVKWTKQDVTISGSDDQDLGLISLSRGGTVTGTLIDEFSNPIVGCQVFLRLTDVGTTPRRYNAKSKNAGVYTIPNVQPGEYKVWSMPMGVDGPAPGGKKSETVAQVRDNQVVIVDLKLDYSTVRTANGRNPRDPNPKFNPKQPLGPGGGNAKTRSLGGGKGGSGSKGGKDSKGGAQKQPR